MLWGLAGDWQGLAGDWLGTGWGLAGADRGQAASIALHTLVFSARRPFRPGGLPGLGGEPSGPFMNELSLNGLVWRGMRYLRCQDCTPMPRTPHIGLRWVATLCVCAREVAPRVCGIFKGFTSD